MSSGGCLMCARGWCLLDVSSTADDEDEMTRSPPWAVPASLCPRLPLPLRLQTRRRSLCTITTTRATGRGVGFQ